MNDEPKELDVQSTLCWRCKHGLTILETQQEHVYHQGLKHISGEEEDLFRLTEFGQDEMPDERNEPELIEHTVEHKRIKTICYWRPDGIEVTPPIGVAYVKECSRFEER